MILNALAWTVVITGCTVFLTMLATVLRHAPRELWWALAGSCLFTAALWWVTR